MLGLLRATKRSIENPSTPLSAPDEWLYDAFGAGPSSSGINVSRVTGLTYAPFWRGIQLISDIVAKVPLHVRKETKGGWKRARKHPAYFLLRRKANEYMTAGVVKKLLTFHCLSNGNGYAWIHRRGDGTPLELVPLNPDCTYPIRANGTLWYFYQPHADGDGKYFRAENIFHLKGLGFDGLQGFDVIVKARESLGLGMAAARYGSIFFRNGSKPNIALEYPARMSDQAQKNLRDSWERAHGGLDSAHRVALLQEGVKLVQYSINAKDAQLIELRKFSLVEVANFLGLPVHKLGGEGRTAFASLEQENQACLDECYDPWLCKWEEECWDKLLTEEEKASGSHEVEFSRRHLVHAPLGTRTTYYTAGIGNGWLCQDDVREAEGMNPIKGGIGKSFFRPLNLAQLGDDVDETFEEDSEEKGEGGGRQAVFQAGRDALADAARRLRRRVATQAKRAAAKPGEFVAWLDTIAQEHQIVAEEMLSPATRILNSLAGNESATAAAVAGRLLGDLRGTLLEASGQATAAELPRAVDAALESLTAAPVDPVLNAVWPGAAARCGGPGSGVPGPCAMGKVVAVMARKFASLPAAVKNKAMGVAKRQYAKLESRYGRKWAVAIMVAGVAGVPIPIPFSTMLTAAPVLAAAEISRRLGGARSKDNLSDEEVTKLGKEFVAELYAEWKKANS